MGLIGRTSRTITANSTIEGAIEFDGQYVPGVVQAIGEDDPGEQYTLDPQGIQAAADVAFVRLLNVPPGQRVGEVS